MIKIENVTKMYGQTLAVKNISFEVGKGEILGFLGPNGAGKTTTMRIITGYFPPTNGDVFVDQYSVLDQPLEVKKRIGYVPENPSMYKDMKVREYIRFIGAIKGVPKSKLKENLEKTLSECALEGVANKMIGELSKGYRQRVALGQALVNDPPVLILDEPTSGLDPKQIFEIRQLIKSMSGDRTIILSTHILPEVSMTCDKVVIINEGLIVAQDTVDNIGRSISGSYQLEMTIDGNPEDVIEIFYQIPGILRVDNEKNIYIIDVEKDKDIRAELARKVVEKGFGLLEFKPRMLSLEEVFLKLVTEEEGVNAS